MMGDIVACYQDIHQEHEMPNGVSTHVWATSGTNLWEENEVTIFLFGGEETWSGRGGRISAERC